MSSTNIKPHIAIAGATVQQGHAVARHLLNLGFPIKILIRNAELVPAMALQNRDIVLVEADLSKKEELLPALEDCSTLLFMQNYQEKESGYEGKIRQVQNLLQAAQQMNVQHLIQVSVSDCDCAPGVKHFEHKALIEKMVQSSGIPYTILRTVMLMEDFMGEDSHLLLAFLAGFLPQDFRLHLTTVEDIGAIAALAISNPEKYQSKCINVASDIVTLSRLRRVCTQHATHSVLTYEIPAWLGMLINQDFAQQLQWHLRRGWTFSLQETRQILPEPTSLGEFFRKARKHTLIAANI